MYKRPMAFEIDQSNCETQTFTLAATAQFVGNALCSRQSVFAVAVLVHTSTDIFYWSLFSSVLLSAEMVLLSMYRQFA